MSTLKLFDVHTHIQFAAFKDDTDIVVRRALDAGVWMVNVGTQKDTSASAIALAEKYPEGVYATVGLHPIHTEKSYHDEKELGVSDKQQEISDKGFVSRGEEFDYEYYKKLASHPKVVAIGECGLDYYRLGEGTREKQKAAFLQQIELAYEMQKPIMIHCRQAFSDLIKMLQAISHNLKPSIVHFFSGTVEDARKLLDLGFSFSFGGVVTFTRDYDEAVKYIPLERVLLETDAPYVAPEPYRGRRNEPAYVIETAKKVASIKGIDFETVQQTTVENALFLFGIKNGSLA